jgi:hypothetical protein
VLKLTCKQCKKTCLKGETCWKTAQKLLQVSGRETAWKLLQGANKPSETCSKGEAAEKLL